MLDLAFHVLGSQALPYSASPEIGLLLQVSTADPAVAVENVLLRCIVRIDAGARAHAPAERERQQELFGGSDVWARAPKQLVWARATVLVPAFHGKTTVEVALPCSYDLSAAASKYVLGLEGGDVPITVQPSGTAFFRSGGALSVAQISHDHEARHRVPVALFREVMERHFPDSAIVALKHDVFARLDRYRVGHGMKTWDAAVESLLGAERGGEP